MNIYSDLLSIHSSREYIFKMLFEFSQVSPLNLEPHLRRIAALSKVPASLPSSITTIFIQSHFLRLSEYGHWITRSSSRVEYLPKKGENGRAQNHLRGQWRTYLRRTNVPFANQRPKLGSRGVRFFKALNQDSPLGESFPMSSLQFVNQF